MITENGKISGDPETVRNIVLAQMISVATTRTPQPEEGNKPWFDSARAARARWSMQPLMPTLTAEITDKEVKDAIKTSGSKRSIPPDGIPNIVYKRECDILTKPLTAIFNKILKSSIIPSAWRDSFTVPIPKDGVTTDPLASRPIALLNNCYKIYTSILNKRLVHVLEKGSYFGPSQGGWRSKRSTLHKILTMVNNMELKRQNEENLHLVWLDLSKFFNSIEIWALTDNMTEMGFPHQFVESIKNMLKGNRTRFRTAFGYTEWGNETRGTRQGDTISATLGLIFLEPLLWHLEEGNVFSTLSDNIFIPPSAFGDDVLMMTDTGEHAQSASLICAEFSKILWQRNWYKGQKEDCIHKYF